MKVVGLDSGRVALLVDLVELVPIGGMHDDEVNHTLQQKYNFAVVSPAKEGGPLLRFERGRAPDGKPLAFFEVHPQGLVAQAADTRTADGFLADVLAFCEKTLGLREPTLSKKVYNSSLVVEFETDIGGLLTKSKALFALFGSQLKTLYGIDLPPALQRLTLKPDTERLPPRLGGLLSEFTLERRIFAPFETHRFYSTAPLPTDKHIELLKRVEELAL